jgi:CheY-like chemotaxis protein
MAHLLVIDDDGLVRASLQILLEANGHSVTLVANGRTGIATVKAGGFDLVICDVFMPDMDGFETLRALHHAAPALPVLVISGNCSGHKGSSPPDFLKMAVDLGAVGSLRKPLDAAEVLGAVDRCLKEGLRTPPRALA